MQKHDPIYVFDKLELFNAFPRRDLLVSVWAMSNNPYILNAKRLMNTLKGE